MADNYSDNNKCIDCGKLITNKAARCRLCNTVNSTCYNATICSECGGYKDKGAKICKKCYDKTRFGATNSNYCGATICPKCGEKKSKQAEVCWQCYLKKDKNGKNSHY